MKAGRTGANRCPPGARRATRSRVAVGCGTIRMPPAFTHRKMTVLEMGPGRVIAIGDGIFTRERRPGVTLTRMRYRTASGLILGNQSGVRAECSGQDRPRAMRAGRDRRARGDSPQSRRSRGRPPAGVHEQRLLRCSCPHRLVGTDAIGRRVSIVGHRASAMTSAVTTRVGAGVSCGEWSGAAADAGAVGAAP